VRCFAALVLRVESVSNAFWGAVAGGCAGFWGCFAVLFLFIFSKMSSRE
jgi:hypothetical protein